jgi:hypothetical protein
MLTSASLPNPSEPGFIGTGAVLGAFAGRAIAWVLGYDADKGMQWAVDGGYWGSGIALGVYLTVSLLEVVAL